MASKKQEEKKKHARKELAKARVLKRREAIRKEAKKHREWSLAEKRATKGIPIKGSLADRDAMILEKLRHNYAILEALDAEYQKEQESRKQINDSLEAEGFKTLKEKMDAMGDTIGAPKIPTEETEYVETDGENGEADVV